MWLGLYIQSMVEVSYRTTIRAVLVLSVLVVTIRGIFTYSEAAEYSVSSSTAPFLLGLFLVYLVVSHLSKYQTNKSQTKP